ncbi:aspartic peptidase domain-containing protein [Roridomyces roridus]|uniref:Aspartic peptidase domain-containing protein n=1 Tax=Roridomyces roridus TaxID=1738132 RepID=A0AAD7B3D1_9AGAR|nr:aspartic peptidase domain-containing protein [Roridomyces roridus]
MSHKIVPTPPSVFDIDLVIRSLSADEELTDAAGARRRFQQRHGTGIPAVDDRPVSAPTTMGSLAPAVESTSPVASVPSQSLGVSWSTASYIPVHADHGPAPAATSDSSDQVTVSFETKTRGTVCQVSGTLIFGEPLDPGASKRYFPVEFDLGSNDTWINGPTLAFQLRGQSGALPLYWKPRIEQTRSVRISDLAHTVTYADGSFVSFELWSDFIYLPPLRSDIPPQEQDKFWLPLTFGAATSLKIEHFFRSPVSGMLGLGRRELSSRSPPTFLRQVLPMLETPEITILLRRTKGTITFGKRSIYPATRYADESWNLSIPLEGRSHWIVASTSKTLNGEAYLYTNGTAELDSGAAFCYIDDHFVQAYYSNIAGSKHKIITNDPEGTGPAVDYYVFPVNTPTESLPQVKLDIGGHMFALEMSRLPGAAKHLIEGEEYYIGAIQPKSPVVGDGPDLIGRVALVNMEINLQMPEDKPHTMSWRRKDLHFP